MLETGQWCEGLQTLPRTAMHLAAATVGLHIENSGGSCFAAAACMAKPSPQCCISAGARSDCTHYHFAIEVKKKKKIWLACISLDQSKRSP